MFDPWIFDNEAFEFMAALDITLDGVCLSGDHLIVGITPEGQAKRTVIMTIADLAVPMTDDEMMVFARCYLRMYANGKTSTTIKNKLTAGMAVAI